MKTIITKGKLNLPSTQDIRRAEVEWSLEKGEHGPVFSASGHIRYKGGGECAGQCLEELAKAYPDSERLQRIFSIWQDWHLNDLNAGTPEQEEAVEQWKANGNKYDYAAACKMLEDAGLYAVPATPEVKASALGGYDKDVYTYGCCWLHRLIPNAVLNEINSWQS